MAERFSMPDKSCELGMARHKRADIVCSRCARSSRLSVDICQWQPGGRKKSQDEKKFDPNFAAPDTPALMSPLLTSGRAVTQNLRPDVQDTTELTERNVGSLNEIPARISRSAAVKGALSPREHVLDLPMVFGMCSTELPDVRLVAAVCKAGGLGVLDLGRDPARGVSAARMLADRGIRRFGIRLPEGMVWEELRSHLPDSAHVLVLSDAGTLARLGTDSTGNHTVVVQVTSVNEARRAIAHGAAGLIAKGCEAGGRVGEETAFVLLQRLVSAALDVPIWVQGGIGLHTAAACIVGGAAGVVLDSQFLLVRESSAPDSLRRTVAAMDGSETIVVDGHRVLARTGVGAQHEHPLPLGQDASFARPLAERFRTASGIVRAIEKSIRESVAAAQNTRSLARGGPLAHVLGSEYPIAQGPMTRVSDRPEFAEAVARAGAVPFLALALKRGDEVRTLLRDTADRLAGRTWGVGILGFVDEDIRTEQLAAIAEVPPPVAIIAGGRPSQARPLESQGTRTFLHVPSPGLLELFLKDGARRFVFEGSECGGHVGPRSSFVLWETQIRQLAAFSAVNELEVLFAGGIHDGRSAAMVATMAAPLAAKGAKIGILMGTAYLFTEEAVSSGAIRPGYRDVALACDQTVLLETAPGHATRCADTPYVSAFREHRERLEAEGCDLKTMWAQLEQLNLGRLRIAAKGVRRDGDALTTVDEHAQHADGMYMIGQVASLRRDVCTMAELHRDVIEGALACLDGVVVAGERATAPVPVDIAIVGMACIFPDAEDLDAYWANILAAKNSIREVAPERWNPAHYYAEQGVPGRTTPSKWGGFVPTVAFDPLVYGIAPNSLASIDPVQLLSLQVAHRALADAGYGDREFDRERVSVIFGAEAGSDLSNAYSFRAMYPQMLGALPEALDRHLPSLTEDSFPGVLSNVIAGRIANRLDLGGSNYTVDAACASSLAALDISVKELVSGTSDMVLCGGADLHNAINDYLLFSATHALSPRGQCRTFDAEADGIVLGEGVACLVLKRLSDAERDGDRVYAVVKAVAGSSDGRSLGLTAPRQEGQARALRRAYERSGVSPARVGMVEAHGTGTVVGDRIELGTLTEVYSQAGAQQGACALGSVKSQIGHTKCAAGLAGVIKAALALHHGVRPPTLNVSRPNPAWQHERSPFSFYPTAVPWADSERYAAVSALGFGGTNFHAVLAAHESDPACSITAARWPAELFLFRGERADVSRALERLQRWLEVDSDVGLHELAASVCHSGGQGPIRVAIVARDHADLAVKLARASSFTSSDGVFVAQEHVQRGKLAFLFPGQGSQYPGMLDQLFVTFARLRPLLELAGPYVSRMFPPATFGEQTRDQQRTALADTRVAQPALGIADLAVADLLGWLGICPDMLGGHSYGELVALCVADVFDRKTLIQLSEARARCILAAAGDDPGTMVAVAATRAELEQHLRDFGVVDEVVIANENAPRQCVLAGTTPSVRMVADRLRSLGVAVQAIPVACAFHSPVVAEAQPNFAQVLANVPLGRPNVPVWSNALALAYPTEAEDIAATLARQLAAPVQFVSQIERMYEAGARVFVEVGPGGVLSGLVPKILGDRPHVMVACDGLDRSRTSGIERLMLALARMATSGVEIDAKPLFAERSVRVLDLDGELRRRAPTTWLVDGHLARPVTGDAPEHAYRTLAHPLAIPSASVDQRESTVLEYLQGVRELVTAQRDVMMRYLGNTGVQAREHDLVNALDVTAHAEPPRPAISAPVPEPHAPHKPMDTRAVLLDIVSNRTGYPPDMLDLDLDLEADLSIDSIKRIEILGALRDRVTLAAGGDADAAIESLARKKTLRAILDWIAAQQGAAKTQPEAPSQPAPEKVVQDLATNGRSATETRPGAVARSSQTNGHASALRRYVIATKAITPATTHGAAMRGKSFAITADRFGIAERLVQLLISMGANARIVSDGERFGRVDTFVHLAALDEHDSPSFLQHAFTLVRQAVLTGVSTIVSASWGGGSFARNGSQPHLLAGGISGLLKTLAHEYPDVRVRTVDLDPRHARDANADALLAELRSSDDWIEVGYVEGERRSVELVRSELDRTRISAEPLLDRNSVVVCTGGARGITARSALALATRFGCRLELIGRSAAPDPRELEAFATASGAADLRRALVATGLREPARIEAECSRLLAAREIAETLRASEQSGGSAGYRSLDVSDPAALASAIDAIYREHGRIDGVLHGAGILEDKLIVDKTEASFARVVNTKLNAALTLAHALKPDVKFVVLFGSISGVFGNRGQIDYSAANDALDKLAWALDRRLPGRVVAIDWGPWSGAGMVTPELAREYARRSMALIDADAGVAALVDELMYGRKGEAQILYCASEPPSLMRVNPRSDSLETRPVPRRNTSMVAAHELLD